MRYEVEAVHIDVVHGEVRATIRDTDDRPFSFAFPINKKFYPVIEAAAKEIIKIRRVVLDDIEEFVITED